MVTAALRRPAVTRSHLFFGVFLVLTLNGFFGSGLRAIEEHGLGYALAGLFGVSAILWVALAAGLSLLVEDLDHAPPRRADVAFAVAAGFAAMLPAPAASSFALALAALWAIATGAAGSPLRRAGVIFLAVTGALLWGRLALAMFSRPLLDLDAMFVSSLIGAESLGNTIWLGDRWDGLVVAPGCSSMQGMSLALVFWATVNQFFAVRFGLTAACYCLAALATTILINVLRIGAMLRWPAHAVEIHHGWGYQLSMWTTLVLVVGICLYGARRDVFALR